MFRTRATSSIWCPITGDPKRSDRWRRRSMRSSPGEWYRPVRQTEKAGACNGQALVWPQRQFYKKPLQGPAESVKSASGRVNWAWKTPSAAAQGLEGIFADALSGAVHGFLVRRRNRRVPGRRRRHRRHDLALLQGPAGLFAASGLRTAGDDPCPRLRWRAARRILQGAPAVSADPGGAEDRDQ